MKSFSCGDAKRIDMVEYLASLFHHPNKIKGNDYWYLSPLPSRNEKEPSFKIDRKKNVWYDHGIGKGGDIIEFGKLYHNCDTSEFLKILSALKGHPVLSFGPSSSPSQPAGANFSAGEKKETTKCKITIVDTRPLQAKELISYLNKRCIPLEIASKYCREVDFLLYSKMHTVIGFENNAGGFELRKENFKGSSSPKDISIVGGKDENLVVFEGFFSFLSFATINKKQTTPLTNCLILNSLSFFEKSRPLMELHKHVHLLLDRDNAGVQCTKLAFNWDKGKYIDRSEFYRGKKDLNEWLIHQNNNLKLKPSIKQGRRF
jgi:DNA primase